MPIECAFSGCSGLTGINIPDGVSYIGGGAFCGCSGLIAVIVPEGINKIEVSMFYDCSSLKTLTIPSSVTVIDNYAINSCGSLTDIYFAGTKEQWENVTKPMFWHIDKVSIGEYTVHCSDGDVSKADS